MRAWPNWWLWVAGGVAWGLLCVGIRHMTLRTGLEMQELLAERHEQIAHVQVLEREVAEAKRLERLERLAAGLGFVKPDAAQLVIAAPEEGLLSRLFAIPSSAASPAGEREQLLNIRSWDEVVVEQP